MEHEPDYKILFERLKKDFKILEDKYDNVLIELMNFKQQLDDDMFF